MNIKNIRYIIFCCAMVWVYHGKAQTDISFRNINFYIVRHAEKDTGADPVLTKAGYLRAGELSRRLSKNKIDKIFVTPYRRTRLTGDSIRLYQKVDTISYKADLAGDDLLNKINENLNLRNVLIIGHSNTIPAIIKRLGIPDFEISEIPANEYDNLFVISSRKNKPLLKRLKYGLPSSASPTIEKMKLLQ